MFRVCFEVTGDQQTPSALNFFRASWPTGTVPADEYEIPSTILMTRTFFGIGRLRRRSRRLGSFKREFDVESSHRHQRVCR